MNSKTDVKITLEKGLTSKLAVENTAVDFEKAISLAGFGKFQYLIITLCGSIFCCVGFQNGLNAYVMPSAQCDLQMTSREKGLLNAVFLGGGLASAFFWGILADHLGRKKVLVFALIMDAIITILSSFSQSFSLFAVFRFLNGFLIGAPGSIIVPYLGEFLGNEHRAPSLCAVGFFWTLSWMILPAAALGVIPLTWSYKNGSFLYNSWRIYVAMFGVPSFTCGIILATLFPESPKFLFSQGKERETLDILKRMYQTTYGSNNGEYPVKAILPDGTEDTTSSVIFSSSEKNIRANKNAGLLMYQVLKQVWAQATSLFSYPIIYSTILASSLMFSNMFGYYGLGLWLPEIFNRFEDHYKVSNVSATVCDVTNRNLMTPSLSFEPTWADNDTLNYMLTEEKEECVNSKINTTVFINTFIMGASCLIGNVMSSVLAKRVGLKILTIVTAFISGISAIAIYFLNTSNQNLIVSCIFLTFVGTENAVITSAVVDLFSTKVRALAVCTAIFAGRLGAVASNLTLGYMLDISCEVPIFLMGLVLLCGSFLAIFLPKNSDSEEPKSKSKT